MTGIQPKSRARSRCRTIYRPTSKVNWQECTDQGSLPCLPATRLSLGECVFRWAAMFMTAACSQGWRRWGEALALQARMEKTLRADRHVGKICLLVKSGWELYG